MKKQICFAILILLSSKFTFGQTFTKTDTLRGMLTPLRTCYDVTYYNLDIKVDPENKTVFLDLRYANYHREDGLKAFSISANLAVIIF